MKLTFKIEGMSCQHCINSIKKQFEKSNIENYEIEIGIVKIEISDNKNDLEKIKQLIEEAGFKVVNERC